MGRASTVVYILVNNGYLVDTSGDGITISLPHRLVSVEEIETLLGNLVYPGEVFQVPSYDIAIMFM